MPTLYTALNRVSPIGKYFTTVLRSYRGLIKLSPSPIHSHVRLVGVLKIQHSPQLIEWTLDVMDFFSQKRHTTVRQCPSQS